MRRGIFGGTFNPIHYGHLRAAEEAREKLEFDNILFVTAGSPPLKAEDLTGTHTGTKWQGLLSRATDSLNFPI